MNVKTISQMAVVFGLALVFAALLPAAIINAREPHQEEKSVSQPIVTKDGHIGGIVQSDLKCIGLVKISFEELQDPHGKQKKYDTAIREHFEALIDGKKVKAYGQHKHEKSASFSSGSTSFFLEYFERVPGVPVMVQVNFKNLPDFMLEHRPTIKLGGDASCSYEVMGPMFRFL